MVAIQQVLLVTNGWSGSIPEIARRCSAHGGHFFSVYWNVNAFGMLVEAIDGKVTAHFESLYPIAPDPPQPDEVRPPWSIGPETEPRLARQTCLALMEQQTGLAFDQWNYGAGVVDGACGAVGRVACVYIGTLSVPMYTHIRCVATPVPRKALSGHQPCPNAPFRDKG